MPFNSLGHNLFFAKASCYSKFLSSEQKVQFLRLSCTLIFQHGVAFNLRRSCYYSISAWGKCIKDPASLILLSQAPLTLLDPWALAL